MRAASSIRWPRGAAVSCSKGAKYTDGHRLPAAAPSVTVARVPPPREPRTVTIVGLRLPLNATAVVLITTLVLIVDYYHPLSLLNWPIGEELSIGVGRVGLFLVVPLVTLLLLRERSAEHGIRIGEWRIGLPVS